jgi:hypothetical protein
MDYTFSLTYSWYSVPFLSLSALFLKRLEGVGGEIFAPNKSI